MATLPKHFGSRISDFGLLLSVSFISLLVVCFVLLSVFTFAAGEEGKDVKSLAIVGNRTVSEVMMLNNIETQEGRPFSSGTVAEDVKRLYALGFFTDIRGDVETEGDGVKVAFIVVEEPLIRDIVFSGNKAFKDERLRRKMKSTPGEALSAKLLKEDAASIAGMYRENGYPLVRVKYDEELDKEGGQAVISIGVEEGPRVRVRKVVFEGNDAYKRKTLLQLMATKKAAPGPLHKWPFTYLLPSGILDEGVLKDDLERIRAFYISDGHIDMAVKDVLREYDKKETGMTLKIVVDEGKLYDVGKVEIEGNETIPTDKLQRAVMLSEGIVYSPRMVMDDIMAVKSLYYDKGYAEVVVVPDKVFNEETGAMDVVYKIAENEKLFIGKINIAGNIYTKDKVIRRELLLRSGDRFDALRAETSRQRLLNTGFFSAVEVDVGKGKSPEYRDLTYAVQERRTGQISFGAGFSSTDGLVGFAEVSQSNFSLWNFPTFAGGGQKVRLRADIGFERADFVFNFTEPYLFDRKISAGFDAWARQADFLADDYDERRFGADVRFGKALGDFARLDVILKFENVDVEVVSSASEELKEQEGASGVASVIFQLTRDTRDAFVFPSSGAKTALSLEVGTISGGGTSFTKFEAKRVQYVEPFPKKFPGHVLRLAAEAGIVGDSFSSGEDDIPIFERFFLGGIDSIRGFEFREVGPKDINDQPLGGNSMFAGSIEYIFPVFKRIRGSLFVDFGNVWPETTDFFSGIVVSAGVGAHLTLPIGPIRVYYGIPLITDEFTDDEDGAFNFNMGTEF